MQMNLPTYYIIVKSAALDAINKIRAGYGKGPLEAIPQGYCNQSNSCPLQRALADCGVVAVYIRTYLYAYSYVDLPQVLITFVRLMDNNVFPELDLSTPIVEA